jgi:hypothetical protein
LGNWIHNTFATSKTMIGITNIINVTIGVVTIVSLVGE